MSWMRGVLTRLRETFSRGRFEAELDEEIRFHIEREVERLVSEGWDPERARAEAYRTFGEVTRVKEDAREDSGIPWIEIVLRDTRVAARGLRRSPVFALSAVLTLALGIGATTAVFSVVDGVLLEPLPYPDPERLVRIHEQNRPDNIWNISVADFLAVEEQQQVFDAVAAVQGGSAAFTGRGEPEQIQVARVTADWFRVLGVEPAEGRGFLRGEDRPGAERVVVLSASFRDRAFGIGSNVLGESVTLDDVPYAVVGVLGHEWQTLAGYAADAWPVYRLDPPPRRGPFGLRGVARLAPGRTLEEARADLDAISRRIFPIYAAIDFRDEKARITPYPLKEMMLGDVGEGLWLVFAAVGGVLLIAVANVGGLFLVRAGGREREMVLRASLGATRRRMAAQLLIESLVVAGLGGIFGVVLAWVGLGAFLASDPTIPRIREVALDGSTLALTAAVSVGAALFFGLAPMLRVGSVRFGARTLRERGSSERSPGWSRVRSALVTGEFALAFALSTGATLLLVSFARLQRQDLGYDSDGVVAMQLTLPTARYPEYEEVRAFWDEALRRLREHSGVASAGVGAALPPGGVGTAWVNNFDLLDRPVADGESEPASLWNAVDAGFLETLGVPLLRGRLFDQRDLDAERPVLLVSESWASRHYPGRDVLGAQLYSGGDRSTPMTVIGVVGDVEYARLTGWNDRAAVYDPDWQTLMRSGYLVARGHGSTEALTLLLRDVVGELDPNLPTSRVQALVDRTEGSLARPRQWTFLLGLFAVLGVLLAGVGVYGILSHYVTSQRKEIGIRVSLGARPGSVRRLVILRGLSLTGLGIVLGFGLSLIAGRWLQSLVFGVSPHDPATLGGVALALFVIAFVACAHPAAVATKIDPAVTLKGE